MSHDPKFFSKQQTPQQQPNHTAPLNATNIFIGNDPPAYQDDKSQQRNVPTMFDARDNKTQFKFDGRVPYGPINKLDPVPDYNQLYNQPKQKRVITAQDSVQLPCNHYKPPANEIKTWMFDGFRKWCPYCNQLTKGENIIRSGQKLSGLARYKMALAANSPPSNNMDYDDDEGNESDLDDVDNFGTNETWNVVNGKAVKQDSRESQVYECRVPGRGLLQQLSHIKAATAANQKAYLNSIAAIAKTDDEVLASRFL